MRTLARFVIVLVPVAVVVVLIDVLAARGFIHFLGIDTQQSDNYDFVSGVGPMIVTTLGFSTLITGAWHALNCHADGCMRIGRFHVAGGQYKVCGKHHKHVTGQPSKLTADVLKAAHELHLDRLRQHREP